MSLTKRLRQVGPDKTSKAVLTKRLPDKMSADLDFAPAFQHSIGMFDEVYNNTKISPQTDICRQIDTITIFG